MKCTCGKPAEVTLPQGKVCMDCFQKIFDEQKVGLSDMSLSNLIEALKKLEEMVGPVARVSVAGHAGLGLAIDTYSTTQIPEVILIPVGKPIPTPTHSTSLN